MPKGQSTITIEEQDFRSLERIAEREGRSVEELVAIAVRDYIARRTMADGEWRARWDALIERIHSRIPEELTPEEIEIDIREARREVREERRARGA